MITFPEDTQTGFAITLYGENSETEHYISKGANRFFSKSDVDEALRIVEGGNYVMWSGCETMADVAERMAAEFGDLNDVPERLQYYIDYEKWGRDLAIEGTFLEGNGFFVQILD